MARGRGPSAAPARDTVMTCPLLRTLALCLVALAMHGAAALAQDRGDPGELHHLRLGLDARTLSNEGFEGFACGSNGGPPRQSIEDWREFATCRPESSGLHEVYVRFDDEEDYIGRAIDDPLYAQGRIGTRVAGHPIILSALFDDGGILRLIRFVTDPRAEPDTRRMAYLLRLAVMNRYGTEGWRCTDLPAAEGETPVGGVFVKQRCDKRMAERALTVEAHLLRKPGQSATDPLTGEATSGQYESWTRVEIRDPVLDGR